MLHLKQTVENLGPLWSNSCFPFEDYNGDLTGHFHGSQNIQGQVRWINQDISKKYLAIFQFANNNKIFGIQLSIHSIVVVVVVVVEPHSV